jgi:hypothetical protein
MSFLEREADRIRSALRTRAIAILDRISYWLLRTTEPNPLDYDRPKQPSAT